MHGTVYKSKHARTTGTHRRRPAWSREITSSFAYGISLLAAGAVFAGVGFVARILIF